jgi:hypothetical protein
LHGAFLADALREAEFQQRAVGAFAFVIDSRGCESRLHEFMQTMADCLSLLSQHLVKDHLTASACLAIKECTDLNMTTQHLF